MVFIAMALPALLFVDNGVFFCSGFFPYVKNHHLLLTTPRGW